MCTLIATMSQQSSGWILLLWPEISASVRLSFAGGRRFTIGTDEPEALLAAIELARGGRQAA